MHAKMPALVELAKHLGLYQPPDPSSLEKLLGLLPPELAAIFRAMVSSALTQASNGLRARRPPVDPDPGTRRASASPRADPPLPGHSG
jgi:hypothetical protein